ncbi:MAG: Delta-1-pyrroline-5-carboxylate dehydrogenase [Chloroflexi bacterium AL-W]|nr:Delta-1-pyrroline-5-carboxylate dehydrogenase [Chloroflexi bacterium AL-N1]NOK68054.1 Delta-1-pyrroline-5-carboxylate dehydrogenase [Chloroflexi bacterium AL-N10]NOK73394.1 Delta-1-pyrroline-5-carboxylate dehydrogenase [Chloroflexi bacterium AL-N5]NOK83308.1 Delta-1-pyrroline-5-carboxylate dehydrogenase [Chloroflexi bacterium AL-W]NOK87725.1 Delta-1-pyrroline-5-carboxylate dehydrogenase [Chloroflexi bacterium AL-N15]
MTQIKIDITEHPFMLAGKPRMGESAAVTCPYDGIPIEVVHQASSDEVTRRMTGHQRTAVLHEIITGIQDEAEVFAQLIALEAGKPIKQARAEVERAIITFTVAAEEATRFRDEMLHLDGVPGGAGRQRFIRCFPIGPIAVITPLTFRLIW